MPNVIKHYGRPMEATVGGKTVVRKDRIFLKSHRAWYEVMPYDNHFIYESHAYGSSIMCTCGSQAVIVNHDVYHEYHRNIGAMAVCMFHMQNGVHADGSH